MNRNARMFVFQSVLSVPSVVKLICIWKPDFSCINIVTSGRELGIMACA